MEKGFFLFAVCKNCSKWIFSMTTFIWKHFCIKEKAASETAKTG